MLAATLVRLPWLFVVPMREAPDEVTHLWVINFMRAHQALPSAVEVAAGGSGAVYGSLPQLGYLPHLLMCLFVPDDRVLFYARLGSLLMGLVTVLAAYRIGGEIFGQNRLLRMALPAMVVFHPQLVFVHSYVNNDSTTCAISSLLIWLLILSIKRGLSYMRTTAIGGLLGWLTLCKYSGLALLPVIGLGMVGACVLNGVSVTAMIAHAGIVTGCISILSGWWFVRNYHEYSGDILGTRTMYTTWARAYGKSMDYHLSPWSIITDHRWWRMFYFSYWGVFGYMDRYLFKPVYWIYQAFIVIGAAGWIKGLLSGWLKELNAKEKLIWAVMLLTCLVNISAMIWASTGNLGGPQGRYFFPSEIPFLALLLLGLHHLGGKAGRGLVIALVVFTAAVCFGAWYKLLGMYGFSTNPV